MLDSQDSSPLKLDLHYLTSGEAIKQLQVFLLQREAAIQG
jgi:hypothetical protein